MLHELPPLPYALNALEPNLSKETLEYHYGKHHRAYVNKLNELIPGTEFETLSLEAIIKHAPEGSIFNNAAQIWNHSFYWDCLTAESQPNKELELIQALTKQFSSVKGFKQAFTKLALDHFGSGWVWLIKNQDGSLAIQALPNAQTPLRLGKTCLLTCDVWEHAYYIDYRNARARYLEKFFEIINWQFIAKNFMR